MTGSANCPRGKIAKKRITALIAEIGLWLDSGFNWPEIYNKASNLNYKTYKPSIPEAEVTKVISSIIALVKIPRKVPISTLIAHIGYWLTDGLSEEEIYAKASKLNNNGYWSAEDVSEKQMDAYKGPLVDLFFAKAFEKNVKNYYPPLATEEVKRIVASILDLVK
jgi:hypothetical protein